MDLQGIECDLMDVFQYLVIVAHSQNMTPLFDSVLYAHLTLALILVLLLQAQPLDTW